MGARLYIVVIILRIVEVPMVINALFSAKKGLNFPESPSIYIYLVSTKGYLNLLDSLFINCLDVINSESNEHTRSPYDEAILCLQDKRGNLLYEYQLHLALL